MKNAGSSLNHDLDLNLARLGFERFTFHVSRTARNQLTMPPEPTNEPERPEPDDDSGSDKQMRVAGMIVGTALIFIGFLDVFLSISGDSRSTSFPS